MKLRTISFMAAMFLFFVGQIANAQIEIGIKGGLNAAAMQSSDFDINNVTVDSLTVGTLPSTDKSDYLLGFNAGIYAIFDLGAVNVMPEVLYSLKGSKNWTTSATGGDINITTSYLSIPILVGLDIADIVTIQVGPQFGFLLDARVTGDDVESYSLIDDVTGYDYGYNNLDIGGVVGVMLDWPGIGHLSVRYNHGLTPAQTLTSGANEFKYFNRTFQASLGIPVFSTDKERAALIP